MRQDQDLMKTKRFNAADFISVTPKYEVYVDCYGFSVKWCEAIKDAIHAMYRFGNKDECESYSAYEAGGVGVRFTTTDKDYARQVERKAKQMLNLARKTYSSKALYRCSCG